MMKRNELFNHKEKSMNLKFTLVLRERSQSKIIYSMVTITQCSETGKTAETEKTVETNQWFPVVWGVVRRGKI